MSVTNIHPGPAEEFVPGTLRCCRNFHADVYFGIIVLDERIRAIVLIPIDMRGRRLLRVDVDSLELHGVLLRISTRLGIRDIFNLRIRLKNGERIARKNLHPGAYIGTVFPLLDFPIAKYLVVRRRLGSCTSGCLRGVNIGVSIRRSIGATSCIIFNYDARGTFQRGVPLCINVELRCNPETFGIRIALRINQEAIIVVGIRHVDGLVVRSFDRILVNCVSFAVEDLRKALIEIPAVKRESSQVPTSRLTDMAAFADSEGHLLICGSPVDVSCCAFRVVNVKEYAVLFLTPLCIDRYAALGHGLERGLLRTSIVKIPAFENIPRWRVRVVRFIGVQIRNIGPIKNP